MTNEEIMRRWAKASSHRSGKSKVIGSMAQAMDTTKKNIEGLLKASGFWMASDMYKHEYDVSRMAINYDAMEDFRNDNGLPSGGGGAPGRVRAKKKLEPNVKSKSESKKIVPEASNEESRGSRLPISRKIKSYKILKESNEYALMEVVNSHIRWGYEPIGGVTLANTGLSLKLTSITYCQAVVDYE